jgi:hypothetical protein
MKVYHGTSADNLPSILANGFDGHSGEQVWTCSAGLNYFWNPADLKRPCGCETMKDAVNEAKRMAKESAESTLAKAKDCRRVVFEVEIPRAELSKDTSCQNMNGAVMTSSTIPPSAITKIWIDSEPLDLFKGYFIASDMGHELRCDLNLTNIEQTVGETFKASSDAMMKIFEILSDMELVEYSPLDKSELVCNSVATI